MKNCWFVFCSIVFLLSQTSWANFDNNVTQTQDGSCPYGWTFESHYPNICYRVIAEKRMSTFEDDKRACSESHPIATLPIFRDLSEYNSYSLWWQKFKPLDCSTFVHLGMEYNKTMDEWIWLDGSSVKFSAFLSDEPILEDGQAVFHAAGSEWVNAWTQATICQIRLDNSTTLDDNVLKYPINEKCSDESGNTNWYYDEATDICYYYDRAKKNWTDATNLCESKQASLAFFLNMDEYNSFVQLLQNVHVPCVVGSGIYLGYTIQNNKLYTVSGIENPFNLLSVPIGDPDIEPQRNCVAMFGWYGMDSWGRRDSVDKRKFVCQKRLL